MTLKQQKRFPLSGHESDTPISFLLVFLCGTEAKITKLNADKRSPSEVVKTDETDFKASLSRFFHMPDERSAAYRQMKMFS